jgi:large subunit ribosomal protein L30
VTWAVVRVRGQVHLRGDVRDTLRLLRLTRANHCVLVPETAAFRGMLQKVKDHVTWGEVSPEVVERLLAARARVAGKALGTEHLGGSYKSVEHLAAAVHAGKARLADLGVTPVLRLPPPRRGYEGIKRAFRAGGALGYRGKDINDLLQRMLEPRV